MKRSDKLATGSKVNTHRSSLTDIGRSNQVSLVSSGLQTVLGLVGVGDGLEVEGSMVSDRLQDGLTLLGFNFLVSVVLDDETYQKHVTTVRAHKRKTSWD